MSKNTLTKHLDLLLIEEKNKSYYVLIKDFSTFMNGYTLHRRKKHFCHYYLQAFSIEKTLNFILMIALKLIVNKLF